MRIRQTATGIELRSTPGCMWGLGLWFVAGGTLCLAIVAFVPGELTLRDRLIASFIGVGVLGGGLYTLATSWATRLSMNMIDRTIRYVRKAPLRGRVVVEATFEQVTGVELRPTHDSDGDRWYDVLLLLHGRDPLLLDSGPAARAGLEAVNRAIGSALRGSRAMIT